MKNQLWIILSRFENQNQSKMNLNVFNRKWKNLVLNTTDTLFWQLNERKANPYKWNFMNMLLKEFIYAQNYTQSLWYTWIQVLMHIIEWITLHLWSRSDIFCLYNICKRKIPLKSLGKLSNEISPICEPSSAVWTNFILNK